MGPKFWASSKVLRFCSYLVYKNDSRKEFITLNVSQIGAFLKIWTQAQIFGPHQKCSDLAQILGKKSFSELLFHTKYEQNRSTFDDAQNFGPFYFDNTEKRQSKFLICCLKKANLP